MNNEFPVRIENVDLLKETCLKFGYVPLFGKKYFDEWIEFIGIKESTKN